MQNQSAVSMTNKISADYMRKNWQSAACDGPGWPAPRKLEIFACADRMEASTTAAEYEAALDEAHRLGMFPDDGAVAQVAQAAVRYAD
jgi:hypothetical protein